MEDQQNQKRPKFALGTIVKFKEWCKYPPLMVVGYYGYTSDGRIMVTIRRVGQGFHETSVPEDDIELV